MHSPYEYFKWTLQDARTNTHALLVFLIMTHMCVSGCVWRLYNTLGEMKRDEAAWRTKKVYRDFINI